jgi:hypothetical protein
MENPHALARTYRVIVYGCQMIVHDRSPERTIREPVSPPVIKQG